MNYDLLMVLSCTLLALACWHGSFQKGRKP